MMALMIAKMEAGTCLQLLKLAECSRGGAVADEAVEAAVKNFAVTLVEVGKAARATIVRHGGSA